MEPGRIIGGKYRLRREIGAGSMGAVWAAVHESLGRAVAVKFLTPTGIDPDTAAARFVAEARMAAAVKHRFVVDIFDFGITEGGQSYMVLELLEGEELGERMYYGPPMAVRDAVRFICACLSGLDKVHEAGIVHRDLKPENIFVLQDADGPYPKLLDFGISKMSADGARLNGFSMRPPRTSSRPAQLTMPGTVIGTPWYMSPEQLRGASNLDLRSDIYSMGVILWEWLVGSVPNNDDNIGDLLISVLNKGAPDLAAFRPELGPELREVTRKALSVDREDRFQTAAEMRDAMQRILDVLPQDWTVVQKSLMERDSLEIPFPSEAPTNEMRAVKPAAVSTKPDLISRSTRPDAPPPLGPADTQEDTTIPNIVRAKHAAADTPTIDDPITDGAAHSGDTGSAVQLAQQRLAPPWRGQQRNVAVTGGALFLLVMLGMLWTWDDPEEVKREVLLPSASAHRAGTSGADPDDAVAQATGRDAASPARAKDGKDRKDSRDDELAFELNMLRTELPDAAIADTPAPSRPRPRKYRKRKKRLIRTLDY